LHARRLDVTALVSANVRRVVSRGRAASGDHASHRADATLPRHVEQPAAVFATALLAPDVDADVMPWTSAYSTDAWELGVGGLLDVSFGRTNVVVGARRDYSRAENVDFAAVLDLDRGAPGEPPVFVAADDRASGRDSGTSFSLS